MGRAEPLVVRKPLGALGPLEGGAGAAVPGPSPGSGMWTQPRGWGLLEPDQLLSNPRGATSQLFFFFSLLSFLTLTWDLL